MNNEKIKPTRGQLYWEIIKIIGLSLVSGGGSPMRPLLPMVAKEIFRLLVEIGKINVEEKKFKRSLLSLEKREIIKLVEKNGKILVYLKDRNNPTIIRHSIKTLLDFKKVHKKWNGKWFMVFFDVPEIQKNKRDYLRRFLNQIGFFQYQKSVYIFPFECKKEITLIKKIIESARYIKYVVAEKIEDENKIKTFFEL